MQKNDFDFFWLWSRSKCPDCNEIRIRSVALPTRLYTKSQINISKHVEKSPKNFEKSKTRKNNHQNSTYVPNLKDLPWFIKPRLQKKSLTYFWQIRHVVLPAKCIYKVSNWYLKACWKKVWKTRTDGQRDRRAYKKGKKDILVPLHLDQQKISNEAKKLSALQEFVNNSCTQNSATILLSAYMICKRIFFRKLWAYFTPTL